MKSDIQVNSTLNKFDKPQRLAREDGKVNVRVIPQLWDETRAARGAYVGWPGISWISVMDKSVVERWLETVSLFFSVLGKVGSAKMQGALHALVVDE